LVAVTSWKKYASGDHVVHLYTGGGARWEAVWVIGGGFGGPGPADGQLNVPGGLRFAADRDGAVMCVADYKNCRVTAFRVTNGGFAGARCHGTELAAGRGGGGGWMACDMLRVVHRGVCG
jgi:hypothetical protein